MVVCACSKPPPPVPPGSPIPAEPDVVVGSMDDECGALLGAFDAWKKCPNLDDAGRHGLEAYRASAKEDFEAGDKAKPDDKAQHAIALSCHRAIGSVRAATERCSNGKPPRTD